MLIGQACRRDRHHERARDRRRRKQALHGLDRDPDHKHEHRERVDERGNHFGPRVTVRRALRRRSPRDRGRDQSDDERRRVGHHVASIRNERQRTRDPAADRLDGGESGGERERNPQRADGGSAVRMPVPCAMNVAVTGRAGPG